MKKIFLKKQGKETVREIQKKVSTLNGELNKKQNENWVKISYYEIKKEMKDIESKEDKRFALLEWKACVTDFDPGTMVNFSVAFLSVLFSESALLLSIINIDFGKILASIILALYILYFVKTRFRKYSKEFGNNYYIKQAIELLEKEIEADKLL